MNGNVIRPNTAWADGGSLLDRPILSITAPPPFTKSASAFPSPVNYNIDGRRCNLLLQRYPNKNSPATILGFSASLLKSFASDDEDPLLDYIFLLNRPLSLFGAWS